MQKAKGQKGCLDLSHYLICYLLQAINFYLTVLYPAQLCFYGNIPDAGFAMLTEIVKPEQTRPDW